MKGARGKRPSKRSGTIHKRGRAGKSRTQGAKSAARNSAAEAIVRLAIEEDLGRGDATVAALGLGSRMATGAIVAKQEGVLSGTRAARAVFARVDPTLRWEPLLEDGAKLTPGAVIARVHGRWGSIVSGERTALNFLQRLSGIATKTARFVELVSDTGVAILDTRKTTPGLRVFEKEAVRHGGGRNHRFALDDAILVKDNHLLAAGGVDRALDRVLAAKEAQKLPVIVEIASLRDLSRALRPGVTRILLDNMRPAQARSAARRIHAYNEAHGASIEIEASGGITLANAAAYALTGVDFLSIGGLTHSAPALDLSLDLLPDDGASARR